MTEIMKLIRMGEEGQKSLVMIRMYQVLSIRIENALAIIRLRLHFPPPPSPHPTNPSWDKRYDEEG